MVLWNFAVGNNDAGWHPVPLRAQRGETVPAAAQRTPHGETTMLFIRDVSIQAKTNKQKSKK